MSNQVFLTIADFSIKLISKSEIILEEGYIPFIPFICKDENVEVQITVECYSQPTIRVPYQSNELVFIAENGSQKFYAIYRSGNELGFVIYNQKNKNKVQQVAVLDENYSTWKVYSCPDKDGKIIPLRYPMGPIIMHYLTVNTDAVLIHASCIFDGKKGRMFSGFSGTGKSTISNIWSDTGNMIINDDRLIIRKQEDGYYAYNTPMYYMDMPRRTRLHSIYLISHSPVNKITQIHGALAISKVLAFCIQNNFDQLSIQNNLNFLECLISSGISVYELGFVPNISVVDFILANE